MRKDVLITAKLWNKVENVENSDASLRNTYSYTYPILLGNPLSSNKHKLWLKGSYSDEIQYIEKSQRHSVRMQVYVMIFDVRSLIFFF